ncbi:MAG: hypothetical protein HY340_02135 [Candidatus Kerfeldbacteria bacterium]|nr:hypothetical protein [Candidatus Kerfeldbacteria bacterium]
MDFRSTMELYGWFMLTMFGVGTISVPILLIGARWREYLDGVKYAPVAGLVFAAIGAIPAFIGALLGWATPRLM